MINRIASSILEEFSSALRARVRFDSSEDSYRKIKTNSDGDAGERQRILSRRSRCSIRRISTLSESLESSFQGIPSATREQVSRTRQDAAYVKMKVLRIVSCVGNRDSGLRNSTVRIPGPLNKRNQESRFENLRQIYGRAQRRNRRSNRDGCRTKHIEYRPAR